MKEAAVLRRKVESLESDKDSLQKQVKELNEKVTSAANKTNANAIAARRNTTTTKGNNLADEKIKVGLSFVILIDSMV